MRITELRVTPVAIKDPPLLNSVGIYEPFALRAVIELETDEGIAGLSETYGDADMLHALATVRDAVIGVDVFSLHELRARVDAVFRVSRASSDTLAAIAPGTNAARRSGAVYAALEVACLDAQGRAVGRPVYDLLGGRLRDRVAFAAYLFFKHGRHRTVPTDDTWGEVLSAATMVDEARSMVARFGFQSLKVKGGVLDPKEEVDAVLALREAFPSAPIRIDPNAAWSVPTSLEVAAALDGVLEYLEDPTLGLEGMADVASQVAIPLATNMVVTSFDDLPRAVELAAVSVILADHHYWGGLRATHALAAICATWGLGLSMHSNSHLGISFAAMAHLGVSVPGLSHAVDTHRPWQCEDVVEVPARPGLGVDLDRDAVARLHEQYQECGIRARDDVAAMRALDPSWVGALPRF